MDFSSVEDYKFNPFTGTTFYTTITNESHTIPNAPIYGGYLIWTDHAPREQVPSSVVITIGATTLTEVPSTITPANNQFRVWYDQNGLGCIEFHANQAGMTALISYQAYGTFQSKSALSTLFSVRNLVYDAATWANLFTRVSANNYKIKDGIYNVYFTNLAGGYDINSILSGGDTYAIISTNQCSHIDMESGAYINVRDTASYIIFNTTNGSYKNIGLKGIGTTDVSCPFSFLAQAHYISWNKCWVANRKTSANNYAAFSGYANTGALYVVTATECVVNSCNFITSSMQHGFYYVSAIGCIFKDNIGTSTNISGFKYVNALLCTSRDNLLTCTQFRAFYACSLCEECVSDTDTNTGNATGFEGCQCSNCNVNVLISTGAGSYTAGYTTCKLSLCHVGYCDAQGAGATCDGVSLCQPVIGCHSEYNTANSTAYGFKSSKKMQQNTGNNNKSASYNACYADSGTGNAAADTAAGGYNS